MDKIILAAPRGFCAGVAYAIEVVDLALKIHGAPIYVRHAIVHNEHVVRSFEERGVVFVETISEIPPGSVVVYSAHGVSPQVREAARARELTIIDATCPLVTKVHNEARHFAEKGYLMVYIGHLGHVEAEGTMGEAPRKEDICYATTNRQTAIRELARQCDLVLIVGSKTSSNSNRLREVAASQGVESYLVHGPEEVRPEWGARRVIGISSGASTPEQLVEEVIGALLEASGEAPVTVLETVKEDVTFKPSRDLIQLATTAPRAR